MLHLRTAILLCVSLAFGPLPGCGGSNASVDAGSEDVSTGETSVQDVGADDATVDDLGAADASLDDAATGDASSMDDAATSEDAGGTDDAGGMDDAGTTSDAGGTDDAGNMDDAGGMVDAGPTCPWEDAFEPDDLSAPTVVSTPAEYADRALSGDDVDAYSFTIPSGCGVQLSWSHDGPQGATWEVYAVGLGSNPVASGAFGAEGSTSLPVTNMDLPVVVALRSNGACVGYAVNMVIFCQ